MTIDQNLEPDFEKRGKLLAIAQEATTGVVLNTGYMRGDEWEQTMRTKLPAYLQAENGNAPGTIVVREAFLDCDLDTALLKVELQGLEAVTRQANINDYNARNPNRELPTADDFEKQNGLLVAVTQESRSGIVLMHGYVSLQSLKETQRTGFATYFSTSRREIWPKGATSGDWQAVKKIAFQKDQGYILLQVEQQGKGACHTGSYSCFYNKVMFSSTTFQSQILLKV